MNNDLTAYNCVAVVTADGKTLAVKYKSDATGDMYYRPDVDAALAALRAQLVQAQARGDTYRRRALVLVRKLSKRKKPKVSMPGAYKRVVGIWRLRDSDAVARAERSMDRDDYIGHSIYDDKPPAPATPPGGEE